MTSVLRFEKYQGLGNDFIIIDQTDNSSSVSVAACKQLCDRHFGVGADGVLLVCEASHGCDFTMKIVNSDGSRPQMCGNGVRCFARFLMDCQRVSAERDVKIWTGAGEIAVSVEGDSLRVNMGRPTLAAAGIPTLLEPTQGDSLVVNASMPFRQNRYNVCCVNMGNPHAVIFVESLDEICDDFTSIGPALSTHEVFPEGANIEFVEVLSRDLCKVKVWERGCGPTLACGTGACAVVVAGALSDRLNRRCYVQLPGGNLSIEWADNDCVYMTGPAQKVFSGEIHLNAWLKAEDP